MVGPEKDRLFFLEVRAPSLAGLAIVLPASFAPRHLDGERLASSSRFNSASQSSDMGGVGSSFRMALNSFSASRSAKSEKYLAMDKIYSAWDVRSLATLFNSKEFMIEW